MGRNYFINDGEKRLLSLAKIKIAEPSTKITEEKTKLGQLREQKQRNKETKQLTES
ncbi:hypothetical protein [Leptospira alstonii]|uniref:hypothetical protein n=1 Tax=Leptospira alstonii TaxID=28452 RepID=UPI0012DD593C|nr:hypothetical protein [Leptospira alstonii]